MPAPEPQEQVKAENVKNESMNDNNLVPEKKAKFGFPASPAQNYTVSDCRALVKTLVCGVKTITWGLTSTKQDQAPAGAAGRVTRCAYFIAKFWLFLGPNYDIFLAIFNLF